MDRELESRAAEIFAEALELQIEERSRFVRARCASDPQLHARVELLLAAHPKAEAPGEQHAPREVIV